MEPVRIEFLMVDKLSARLDNAVDKMEQMTGKTADANRQVRELDKNGMSLEKTIGKVAAAFTIRELVSNITKVRGEFQQLEVAFETMLGSAEKAKSLMGQLTQTAATTPFGLEDVAQGAKQLLAYGLEAEKVNETLIRLGDIAAGLSIPLGDLVYLYGTTMAQGRLYTQDLNQFTGRGLPMIGELAKQFGVAEGKVKELVEAGKVGFPEVRKVIESLTDEGGKFGGLMEAQSGTITGQISNIEDAISMMLNDIGQQSEGIINTTLGGVSYMIEHYERFGRILLGIVATYGVYRTAIMTVAAAKGWATAAEALHYNWLLLVEKAQKMLNATMLANPYVLVATAIAGVVAVMVSMKTEAERLKEADEAYEAQKQKIIEAEEEHKRRLEELCDVAGDESLATDTRREALNKLEMKYPSIFAKYDTELEKLKNIKKIKEEIAELEAGQSITQPKNELKSVEARIKELEKKKGTERWEEANASGTNMRKQGGLSAAEEAELKNLYNKRKQLGGQVRKNEVNAYFEKLTGVSNETLKEQIKQRENLLALMKTQEKKYGTITYGNVRLRGTYSQNELEYQLNKLKEERARRGAPRKSSSNWGADVRKEYQAALKAYNDFLKNPKNNLTQEEFEKKAKELKDAVDTAKKEYDKTKPGEDKDSERERKAQEKASGEAEKRKQVSEELGRELVELQHSNDEAETEAMEDGLAKKLRQIDDEYRARADEIARMEAKWKLNNKKAGASTGGDGLTDSQRSALGEAGERNLETRRKAERAAYEAEYEAMQEDLLRMSSYNAETEKLREERRKSEQEAIEGMKEGSDKRLRQIKLDYEKETAEIETYEKELRKAQGGSLTKDQREGIVQRYAEAHGRMEEGVRGVEATEVRRGKSRYEELLQEYKDYDRRRREIDAEYSADMNLLEAERDRLLDSGGDTADVESSIHARTEARRKEIQSLEAEILQSTDFYDKLFGDTSEKGYKVLRDFYTQAKDVMDGAKAGADGVEISVPYKDADGKFVQKAVKVTVSEFQKMKKQVDSIRKELEKNNPFAAFRTAWSALSKAVKEGGDVSGALNNLYTIGMELSQTIRGWSVSLGAVFGDRFKQSMDEILTFCDGAMDMGTGIAQIWSGDIVGGITNTLSGLGSIVSMFSSWKEKMEEMKREWYIAEIETNRSIRERSAEYAASQSRISDIIKDVELLNWLVEKGYAKPASVSVWEAQTEQLKQLQENLEAESRDYDALWSRLQGSNAHWEWGNSLNGGSVTMSLRGMSAEQIELYYNQNKLSDAARDYYEAWVESGKTVEELKESVEECYATMREMVMGVSFDSFLSNAADALKEMRSDISSLGEFTEDTLSEAILNAFMYKDLAGVLEPLYNELSENLINGTADENYIENWRRRLEEKWEGANRRLGAMADAAGVEIQTDGTSQSAKAGSFSAMTQDQGTKLEGMFTNGLQHWSSMDAAMENVSEKMNSAENHLARIEENTGKSAGYLEAIVENMLKIIRDGLKVK